MQASLSSVVHASLSPAPLSQAGKLARSIWAEACATDEKDAILGVQQARNAMTACTYLATISVALATAGAARVATPERRQRGGSKDLACTFEAI